MKAIFLISTIIVLFSLQSVFSQPTLCPKVGAWKVLENKDFSNLEGETLNPSKTAIYSQKEDLRAWYGFEFDVFLDNDHLTELKFGISIHQPTSRHDFLDSAQTSIKVAGKGWKTLTIPITSFDYNRGQSQFLKYIDAIKISANAKIGLKNIRLIKGNPLNLQADIRSKSGDGDSTIWYSVSLTNSSNQTKLVNLSLQKTGWEDMKSWVEPAFVSLKAGEEKAIKVYVTVPKSSPQGSQEKQTLVACSGNDMTTLDFISMRTLKGTILYSPTIWNEIKAKIQKYDWAKKELEKLIKQADEFQIPQQNTKRANGIPCVFPMYLERKFIPMAFAYQLTGDKKYGEKIAALLKRFSAADAFPALRFANSGDMPQEGGMIAGLAQCYDVIKDANFLTAAEKEQVENSFRLYINIVKDGFGNGGISNWTVFNLVPAAECALMLHDMVSFNELMNEPCGIIDHLRYGVMDDGWWYEVSLAYNVHCVKFFTQLGIVAKPFGIDFLNQKFPVALTQKVGLRPFEFEKFRGMECGKFGAKQRNFFSIKDMWDGILIYPDYRGVMFGMGDGHEERVGGEAFELAYYAYRDSNYAAQLKQVKDRDLVYGIIDLPQKTPILYTLSGHSDNAGVAVLRSQTDKREQAQQIQAAVKYGSHGSYHGHYDRISLLSLMRYGRSFWNPETSWFGYASYMYKWWVQPSMAHNMVVVDGKMQEPNETNALLFHSGKMMQAIAIETTTRWSNPPYMGGYEQVKDVQNGTVGYVNIPTNYPKNFDVSDYTEPVLQRRLMIVTDDYVVLSDYLKAEKEHTFDNLLHLKGAKIEGLRVNRVDANFDNSPLSSGQFITNVRNYITTNGVKITSKQINDGEKGWDAGGFDGLQEKGILNVDVFHVYPPKAEVRIGNYAEGKKVQKKVVYQVLSDDKILATDSLGTWILGNKTIEVSVSSAKTLQLKVKADRSNNTKNTLFWANAKIITSKGKEIKLSDLKPITTNIIATKEQGKDYEGAAVKIAGTEYTDVIATEPQNIKEYAVLNFDISAIDAKTFKANFGGDFPVGDEDQIRKTTSYRVKGKEARFLMVLEPYEDKAMVKKVTAISATELIVELQDGRQQRIVIDSTTNKVSIIESKDGKEIRKEETK